MFAINQLVKHHISGAPVVDANGKLVGMLSAMDCMQVGLIAAEDTCVAGPVSQFMSTKVVSVSPDTSMTHLCSLFTNSSHRRYPVVDDGNLHVLPVAVGANVIAVNTMTGFRHETVAGNDGRYQLAALQPGTYQIKVTPAGDAATGAGATVTLNFT